MQYRGTPTASRDLLTGGSDTNDDALTPALVAGLQRSTHDINIACAVKGVVAATISHLNQLLLDGLALEVIGIDKVGGAKLARPLLLARVHIDYNDLARLVDDGTLYYGQTDAAGAENGNVGALLNVGSHTSSTVTSGDTAAKQTCAVHGGILLHSNNGDIGDNGVLREGRGTHEVQQVLALALEAGGAIGHLSLTLGGTNLAAEVGFAGLAELALLAFRSATITR